MGECGRGYSPRQAVRSVLHRAIREGWPAVAAEAANHGGLPKRVAEEIRRYLECGDLRCGFAHVQCQTCHESVLVAFSCKGRLCPSCGARRAEETAEHCSAVLPRVAYRQWTVSLPRALRWAVVKTPKLLKAVERRLVRAVWRWQRQTAKRLGYEGPLEGGAVAFTQLFGSALQLTPHLHVLVPEGLWMKEAFVPLPPPDPEEVGSILRRILKQLAKDFDGLVPPWASDGLELLQLQGVQHRLQLGEADEPSPRRPPARLAVLEGFRLHADSHVQANDRQGLERLCRYGSRGPVALERLSVRDDGRYEYRTKRGPTLVLTAQQLVKRLVALLPAKGRHLTCFHGVFAPNAALRSVVTPSPTQQEHLPAKLKTSGSHKSDGPERPRFPRLDWATLQQRTFGVDVWTCRCGGRRKVLAVITSRRMAQEQLRNLGLLEPRPPPPAAQGPPQLALTL